MQKVTQIFDNYIQFSDDYVLTSDFTPDSTEEHYLDFTHIELSDFDGLEFNLNSPDFFKRIPGYGIELIPIKGHSVKIPGYGYNNGFYSEQLNLAVIHRDKTIGFYDITECQVVTD